MHEDPSPYEVVVMLLDDRIRHALTFSEATTRVLQELHALLAAEKNALDGEGGDDV
jgi:hypothetical protein